MGHSAAAARKPKKGRTWPPRPRIPRRKRYWQVGGTPRPRRRRGYPPDAKVLGKSDLSSWRRLRPSRRQKGKVAPSPSRRRTWEPEAGGLRSAHRNQAMVRGTPGSERRGGRAAAAGRSPHPLRRLPPQMGHLRAKAVGGRLQTAGMMAQQCDEVKRRWVARGCGTWRNVSRARQRERRVMSTRGGFARTSAVRLST